MGCLTGRVVVITGAAGGLGAALSRGFGGEGCRLFLTDCQEGRLKQLNTEITESGVQACSYPADLSRVDETRAMIAKAVQTFGQIDILVNNAGVSNVKPLLELDESDWDGVFNVNVKGLFFSLQAGARHMLERGGAIINIASVAGRVPRPTLLHYAASKAAVISITRSAALGLAKNKIRVNAIAPGMMDTEMLRDLQSAWNKSQNGDAGQPASNGIPLGRVALPEEIVSAALFLASDGGAYITGQTINVCGGIVMS